MMRRLIKLAGLTLVLGSATAMAVDSVTHNSSSSTMKDEVTQHADNTDLNTRDKSGDTLTPQKQPNSESDVEILAAVRSAIVDDNNLSTAAHNVKIMVVKGVVTLRGPVKSTTEKAQVEERTRKVAGVVSIDNLLDVDTK